jgi:hypothetical protein
MADREKVGVGLSATALIAGVLTGTLLRSSSAPEPKAPTPARVEARRTDASGATSALAHLHPVMVLLGPWESRSIPRSR